MKKEEKNRKKRRMCEWVSVTSPLRNDLFQHENHLHSIKTYSSITRVMIQRCKLFFRKVTWSREKHTWSVFSFLNDVSRKDNADASSLTWRTIFFFILLKIYLTKKNEFVIVMINSLKVSFESDFVNVWLPVKFSVDASLKRKIWANEWHSIRRDRLISKVSIRRRQKATKKKCF